MIHAENIYPLRGDRKLGAAGFYAAAAAGAGPQFSTGEKIADGFRFAVLGLTMAGLFAAGFYFGNLTGYWHGKSEHIDSYFDGAQDRMGALPATEGLRGKAHVR